MIEVPVGLLYMPAHYELVLDFELSWGMSDVALASLELLQSTIMQASFLLGGHFESAELHLSFISECTRTV